MRASRLTACLIAALALAGVRAGAEAPQDQVITSLAPAGSSVTIYRAPYGGEGEFNLEWLQGYALITETREVDIPAGRATIRFEGVAAGMMPESAIVTGLPAGVREKNLDADLLSPASLYARSFGRPVTLRRTHGKSGKSSEEPAIIRSGPDGSVILQTKDGFEAANCGPLNEQLVYPELPAGLSPRPTLSVQTDSPAPARARLTLSYLAWGFDWRANYVLRLRPDGRHADMTAWVSLASSDTTSFPDTTAAVVGGKLNFDETRSYDSGNGSGYLTFHCYLSPPQPMSVGMAVPAPPVMMEAADIVMTAAKMERRNDAAAAPVVMQGEDLGDLKLYRMPVTTTVAARAQKQVALFDRKVIAVTPFYSAWLDDGTDEDAALILRTHNKPADGLGIALPGGAARVFAPSGEEFVLIGGEPFTDKAVGETVEIAVAPSPQVHVTGSVTASGPRWRSYRITVTNANPRAITFEGKLRVSDDARLQQPSTKLKRQDGNWLWTVSVPANGRAVLTYRVATPD